MRESTPRQCPPRAAQSHSADHRLWPSSRRWSRQTSPRGRSTADWPGSWKRKKKKKRGVEVPSVTSYAESRMLESATFPFPLLRK